jgi:soluble lytic murein transglycosylase
MSSTSSTSKADMETLEQIIELVRKRKSAEATQLQASLSDPVARKLTEWMILRSDDNGASSERYKAFITEIRLAERDIPPAARQIRIVG